MSKYRMVLEFEDKSEFYKIASFLNIVGEMPTDRTMDFETPVELFKKGKKYYLRDENGRVATIVKGCLEEVENGDFW